MTIEPLIDPTGRVMKKLRLNLLDACNMRCMYCMPEDQKFQKINDLLSADEMKKIVANLLTFGVDEVRLTGGEPLLHPNFRSIIEALSPLKLKKLAITTNAILLEDQIPFLLEHGVKHINISLDSLQKKSFEFITKTNHFDTVFNTILKAKKAGFKIKLNTVMLKNINYEEIENFLAFSAKHDIEVRFLELMKIGQALSYHERHFVSADEAISRISENWNLEKVPMPIDSTSFNYLATNNGNIAKLGFIASESKPFCDGCSRLRLSNKGQLRPCIMINEGPNIKDLNDTSYEHVLNDLIAQKPTHRLFGTEMKMNEIGG